MSSAAKSPRAMRGDGNAMSDTLIDRIYEAAFVPERWRDVLDEIACHSGSETGALLIYRDEERPRWRASEKIDAILGDYCTSDAWQRSELTPYMLAVPPAAFFYDADYFPTEVLERDFMREPLRALGLGNQLGALIAMPSGENVVLTFERRLGVARPSKRDMDMVNGLRPHLARAGMIAARLGLERAQATVSALSALGLPAAVLSSAGRLLATNHLFDDMDRLFLPVAFGSVAIAGASANKLFQQTIAAARSAREPVVRSIPVKAVDDRTATVIHVLPLRRSAQDIFSGADIIVAATEIGAGVNVPAPKILSALFDLTPAEARLATALAAGQSLTQIAHDMNIQFGSARTYLARVFVKTGTNQQSQLVALLRSFQPVAQTGQAAEGGHVDV